MDEEKNSEEQSDSSQQDEKHLRELAVYIMKQPNFWMNMSGCYDSYCQATFWNSNWARTKYRIYYATTDFKDKTLLDIVNEELTTHSHQTDNLLHRVELNSYFTTRAILVKPILNVGVCLQASARNATDHVLGLLAQSVAYWFGNSKKDLTHSYRMCMLAAKAIENRAKTVNKELNMAILSAVTQTWIGLCIWKTNQLTAKASLTAMSEYDVTVNPLKYKATDQQSSNTRVIPAVSSLTLADEMAMANPLIKAVETFDTLIQLDVVLKTLMGPLCPALILMTNRVLSYVVSLLGSDLYTAKSWYTTFVLAKLYDLKATMITAATQLLKLLPCMDSHFFKYAEAKVEPMMSDTKSSNFNAYTKFSLAIAKAIACYKTKKYEVGLKYLCTVLTIRSSSKYESNQILSLSEAYIVLGLYKVLQATHKLDFSMVPDYLKDLSPSGLIGKGFKLLICIPRTVNTEMIEKTGWGDLCYNYQVLSTILQTAITTMISLKQAGKLREFRCYTSDVIFLAQQMGLVSRTIQLLNPAAEMDLMCRKFDSCQLKLHAMDKMMRGAGRDCVPNVLDHFSQSYVTSIRLTMEAVARLKEVSTFSWKLKQIILHPSYYALGHPEPTLKKEVVLTVPAFLEHALNCNCYLCTHPSISSDALNAFNLQARFAKCNKEALLSTKLLLLSKHYHQRAMFRFIYNVKRLTECFDCKDLNGAAVFEAAYASFFLKPRIQAIKSQMECASSTELRFIASSMNYSLAASKMLEPNDFLAHSVPVEITMAAVFKNLLSKPQTEDYFNKLYSVEPVETNESLSQDETEKLPLNSIKIESENLSSKISSIPDEEADGQKVYLLEVED